MQIFNRASNSIVPVGIIFQLADGRIQGCNKDAETILGYEAEAIVATPYSELPWQTIHEDGSVFSIETHPAIATLQTGQPSTDIMMGFYKPNGELVWLLVDSQPLFQGQGELLGVVTTLRDITSQKNNELVQLANETFGTIADRIPGVIYIYDVVKGRNIYLNSQTHSLLGYETEEVFAIGENFTTQVMHPEDKERLSSQIEKLTEAQDNEILRFEYRMRHKNSQWRWFCSQERVFKRNEDGSVRQIIGIARDISHRKQIELDLIESQKRLNLATIASGIGMWFWDLAADKLEWTDQCNSLFGLDADAEISYKRFLSILHPEDRDRLEELVGQVLTSKAEYDTEYRVVWSDGSVHWIAAKGKVFYDRDNEPVGMMGTVQDISKRKQTEAQLVKTNNILNSIISDTTDLIFVKDLQGRYIVANQATADFLELTIEEILNRDDTELFDPEIARSIAEVDRQIIREGTFISYEEKMRYQGIMRSLLTNKYPWRDEAGNLLGIIGICRDITAIKESQRKLQENEELLRLALSNAKAGSWDWEIATGKITWSPENYELHGIDPQIQPLQYRHWENSLHRDDIQKTRREVQRVLAGESSEFRTEFRIIHPQKGVRWLLHIGNLTRNSQGQSVRLSGINLDITESKEIEEKLRNSEQQLRRVIDSLYSFVGVLTPDGVMVEANRTALKAANLSLEDVVNKPFDQTYWWSYSTQVQSQLRTAIAAAASGEKVRYDVTVRVGTEKYILIDFSIVPLLDNSGSVQYLIPSGIDITDREASKQALLQSQNELKLIAEAIPQQIWTALPDGTIDYINQRWQNYTGISLQQLQQGWESIAHPEDLPKIKDDWQHSLATGENFNIQARLRSRTSEYRWFLCRARPLRNERGVIIKWYGTNTNITRIVELEEKLRAQTADLAQANQLKDEFLAVVSHELRTPLNPILGWSQLIASGSLDPQRTAVAIEVIQRNAQLQVQLINDLLDVSRILRGKLNLELIPVNLETVIKSAIATVELTAQAKSIEIATELEPNIGLVLGDVNRLQQIVWNILSNAIKFTPDGGLVTVRLKRIEPEIQSHSSSPEKPENIVGEDLAASDRYKRARIEITDTGIGIESEFLPHVFDRFRQAESGNTRKFGGLGLGLAIVRYLTELHNGTVTVESRGQNCGATFKVTLPLIERSSTNPTSSSIMKESMTPDRLAGIQILAIDDEIDSLELLNLVFQQEGANVTAVSSAKEALEAIERVTPDLIISDIGMPKIDGYTLMNQIRSLPQGKQIPAIALTAYAGDVDRQHSLNAGFQHHIAKPINIDRLLDIALKLLSDR